MRKPLTGAILGFLLGLAIAVILQQQGVWPLDQITVFLVPAVLGLIGMLALSMGREGSTVTYIIALILMVPALVWGALGVTEVGQKGQLNGGCTVMAFSSVPDETVVTDTSRGDPFRIDPQGSLRWEATSPTAFMDYQWEMWVELGGIAVPFDSGMETNHDGDQDNDGDVANIEAYAESKGVDISQIRGVFMVGGFASTCDGFGFLLLVADGLTTIALTALIIAILILILLIILTVVGRGSKTAAAAAAGGEAGSATGTPPDGGLDDGGPGLAAEMGAAAIASGYGSAEDLDKLSGDDYIEVQEALKDIAEQESDED